jgi:hypothetical protein
MSRPTKRAQTVGSRKVQAVLCRTELAGCVADDADDADDGPKEGILKDTPFDGMQKLGASKPRFDCARWRT